MTIFYFAGRILARFVRLNCIRPTFLHPERFNLPSGFVLACSHLSHLEPFIVSTLVNRKIDWIARIEFYKYRIFAAMLDGLDAIPINRQGVPVRAIRVSIARAKAGKIVGIFPEGGVAHAAQSALRGGPIKKGACVIAQRATVPIIPVVVVGADRLNRVAPWLPFGRAKIWMIFGNPIYPNQSEPRRRAARDLMATELQTAFASLYQELCVTCNIDDKDVA